MKGERKLPEPESAPPGLYGLLQRCWQIQPEDRPDFQTVLMELRAVKEAYCLALSSKSTEASISSLCKSNNTLVSNNTPLNDVEVILSSSDEYSDSAHLVTPPKSIISPTCQPHNAYTHTPTMGSCLVK
jgi:hypothetical protein